MKRIVTFGEIMGRITPGGFLRFRQALPGDINMTFAGAEANVAASIAYMGGCSGFVTALPDNDITDACISQLKGLDVDTSCIVFNNEGRLGLYFTEAGANQRPSRVIYDRSYSSVSLTSFSQYDWDTIFEDAGWFHVTGITPALSETAAKATLESVKKAKEKGITVSCDLNYRGKLWQWDKTRSSKELAGITMSEILPFVDVLVANEEDASSVLGINADNTDVSSGKLDVRQYEQVAQKISEKFPNVKMVATTFRESISASHNNWGAMLYDCAENKSYYSPTEDGSYSPYTITHIVDRVGGGDSFAAGLIFALNDDTLCEPQKAISYAAAASCLAHSIMGDFNFNKRDEIEILMNGSKSGRVVR
ncbi:MAG: PfkB family carbohydrate kinase [Sedimentisphaeraceae bacterium JB056]